MTAAKAARIQAGKLKLCGSLAAYLEELAPKQAEAVGEVAKPVDTQGMQMIGKKGGDSAETDPWATLAKGKKGKKKKGGQVKASSTLQHSMMRLNGFAEVRSGQQAAERTHPCRSRGSASVRYHPVNLLGVACASNAEVYCVMCLRAWRFCSDWHRSAEDGRGGSQLSERTARACRQHRGRRGRARAGTAAGAGSPAEGERGPAGLAGFVTFRAIASGRRRP